MAITNQIDAAFQSFNVLFNKAFAEAKPLYKQMVTEVQSKTKEEVYLWLSEMPEMREWIGDRHIKDVEAFEYRIKNKDWESTIALKINDIKDNLISGYAPRVADMGRRAKLHPDKLLFELIPLGFSYNGYDGVSFFNAAHPVGDTTVSNHQTGASDAWYLMDLSRHMKPFIFQNRQPVQQIQLDKPTDERVFQRKEALYGVDARYNVGFGIWQFCFASKATLNATNYAALKTSMESQKDAAGVPLDISPTHLVFPASLEASARTLIEAQLISGGDSNIWYKTIELIKAPRLG